MHPTRMKTWQDRSIVPPRNYAIPQLYCQIAHTDESRIITDVNNVRDMHSKIALEFNLNYHDIMYCTENTNQLDVSKIITDDLNPNAHVFVHVRGRVTIIQLYKEESLGGIIDDTGCGTIFIREINPGGVLEHASRFSGGKVQVGDQIEAVNGISFIGSTTTDLGNYMSQLPFNSLVEMKLVCPVMSPKYNMPAGAAMNVPPMLQYNSPYSPQGMGSQPQNAHDYPMSQATHPAHMMSSQPQATYAYQTPTYQAHAGQAPYPAETIRNQPSSSYAYQTPVNPQKPLYPVQQYNTPKGHHYVREV